MTLQTKYKDIRVTTNYEKNSKSIWPKNSQELKQEGGEGEKGGSIRRIPKNSPMYLPDLWMHHF